MGKITRTTVQVATLLMLMLPVQASSQLPPAEVDWKFGDVFVAIGNGQYKVFRFDFSTNPPTQLDVTPAETTSLTQTIGDSLGGATAGCAFDSAYRLFGTNFDNTDVDQYSINGAHSITGLQPGLAKAPLSTSGSGFLQNESIVFDGHGNFLIGFARTSASLTGGGLGLFDHAGTLLQHFTPAIENKGVDWIDIATDGQTVYYTSEGRLIKRFKVTPILPIPASPPFYTSTQLTDFANLGTAGGSQVTLFALRILPPGNGTGGVLVADKKNIKLINSSGAVARTYDAAGQDDWEELNLDPNGLSFWAGDATTGNFYRFNISSGAIEGGPFNIGTGTGVKLGGLCLDGAFSAAQPTPISLAPVTFTPSSNTATFKSLISGVQLTVTLVGLTNKVDLTFRSTKVDPSVAQSDPFNFQLYQGIPTSQVIGNLPCDTDFTSPDCEVIELEANPNSGFSSSNYFVVGPSPDTTTNVRLLRNLDEDITTSEVHLPLSGTRTKCILTINQAPSTGAAACPGSISPTQFQVFNQGKSVPFKFQAAANPSFCQNGPFLTNLNPLLLIVQLIPPAAPSPVQVVVAGGSGGAPTFTLGGTGSNGNNTTYQLQVKTTNMPVGNYRATVIDLNNIIPSFGVDFTLQ